MVQLSIVFYIIAISMNHLFSLFFSSFIDVVLMIEVIYELNI